MTQTTPSHSQAVEAAERRLSSVLARSQKGTAFWSEITEAINDFKSAITSQQEVAAPVSDAEVEAALEGMRFTATGLPKRDDMRRALEQFAASRVPVASLASREQGVEAVGAVPGEEWILNFVIDAQYGGAGIPHFWKIDSQHGMTRGECAALVERAFLCWQKQASTTAPPSSKTQDDLAGTDSGEVTK